MAADSETRAALASRLTGTLRDRVGEGAGWSVLIEGTAGMGKTTLARALAAAGEDAGATVWWAGAREHDRSTPFATIDRVASGSEQLTAGRRRDVVPGPDGIRTLAAVVRFGAVDEIVDLVEGALAAPTVIVVEDLHLADQPSIEALSAVAGLADTHPLVLVATTRAVDNSTTVPTVEHVVLGPLTDDEVDALVRRLSGEDPSEILMAAARRANGNPLLIEQLVRLPTGADTDGPPNSLAESVNRRLAVLGDVAADLIRSAAVVGESVDVAVLAELCGRPVVGLAESIRQAVDADILAEDGPDLRFHHALLRDAVYEAMPTSVRAAMHTEVARVLAARHAPAALVGSHLVLGSSTDGDTVEQLLAAAGETTWQAPEAALDFLDRALQLAADDIVTRRLIERARMEALTGAGRLTEAEASAHWLLAAAEPAGRTELLSRLGGLAIIAGEGERAQAILAEAIESAPTDRDRSPILAAAALNSATIADYGRAAELAAQAIEVGTRTDEPVGRSVGLALTARMSTYGNSIDEGLRMGAEAVAIADSDPSGVAHQYVPALHYGMTAFDADELDTAMTTAARGFELADTFGIVWSRPLFGALRAAVLFRRGELDDARAEAATAIDLAERTNSRQTSLWCQALLALVAVHTGEVEEAQRWVAAATDTWQRGESLLGVDHAALAEALTMEAAGDPEAACRALGTHWDRFEELGLAFCHPLLGVDLARLARLTGCRDRAEQTRISMRSAADLARIPAISAAADWIDAMAAEDATPARRALDSLRRTERHLEVARWLWEGAPLLDADPAQPLEEARRRFTALGATGLADRVRDRLAELGETRPPAEVTGWEALTRTELAIARLLGEGCTNAEIAQRRDCSRRTIESHLGRIYRKLAIDGRAKLTVASAEHFRATSEV